MRLSKQIRQNSISDRVAELELAKHKEEHEPVILIVGLSCMISLIITSHVRIGF